MTEPHAITVEPYLTGNATVDRCWPEYTWTCTCGASDILDTKRQSKARAAGEAHLAEVHGQTPEPTSA